MSRKVLLAGPDQKSLILLGDSLKEKGCGVLYALDGARALDLAVSESPDLILLDMDVPIIDGERLAAILRANPKAEAIPIIFVAREQSDIVALQSYHDGFLPKPMVVDDAVLRIESIFGKETKVREVSTTTGATQDITGSLSQIPLVDLLQVFGIHKREGTIRVESSGRVGEILLRDGSIISAREGRVEGEKALFRLLTWQEGTFEFTPCTIHSPPTIAVSSDNLLIEGMRQMTEWEKVKGTFPRRDSSLRVKMDLAHLPKGLRPITQEVLLLLEYYSQVGDVVDNCPFPDYECYLTLQALIEKGVVEEIKKGKRDRQAAKGAGIPPEKILKLKEIFSVPGRSKLDMEHIRVCVYSPNTALLKRFSSRMRSVPGASVDENIFSGPDNGFIPCGVMARVPLGETLELHFLCLPGGEEFSPLWRVFSTRSIGGIVICDGSIYLKDAQAVRSVVQEGKNSGVVFACLPGPGTREKRESVFKETLKLGKDDVMVILSEENPDGASVMINELLDKALS